MIKKKLSVLIFLSIYINMCFSNTIQELDRIVAIVNKSVITNTDLKNGINKALSFFEQNSINPPEENIIEKKVLDELIEQKIIEGYAEDYNIKVSQEDLDSIIETILKQNNITLEEFKSTLLEQNSSFSEFVDDMRYDVLIRKVKNREIGSKINISDFEVKKHKEKMAKIKPDIYDISHILIKFSSEPSTEEKKNKRILGQEVYQKLSNEDFKKIAYEYSDAPDANLGGALGKLKKSELPEIFIKEISAISDGEYTQPFESNNGIHIVKINHIESYKETKNTNKVIKKYFLKQIVIKTNEVTSEDDVIKRLKRLKKEINAGAEFELLAKKYSEDFSSTNGGEIGWIPEGLDPKIDEQLLQIDQNEVSEPFITNIGWHIIQYTDSKLEDFASENIDNKIKSDLINERTELLYQDWYSSLKSQSFIEIRDE